MYLNHIIIIIIINIFSVVGFGSDFKIIIFFIIPLVVSVVTVVSCVAYWHAD